MYAGWLTPESRSTPAGIRRTGDEAPRRRADTRNMSGVLIVLLLVIAAIGVEQAFEELVTVARGRRH